MSSLLTAKQDFFILQVKQYEKDKPAIKFLQIFVSGSGQNDIQNYSDVCFVFDIGTNSIYWEVFRINDNQDAVKLINAGVGIFSDGRELLKTFFW